MATATLEKTKTVDVYEFVDNRATSLSVDAEKGVISGVKILGFASVNKRSYPPHVVREAAHLYEGVRVNVDHAPKESRLAVRNYQEQLGDLRNVRFVEGKGLFGDLHYNPKHVVAEQLAWDAVNAPHRVGLSHNAICRSMVNRSTGAEVIESISKVRCVDLVSEPAATKNLFESVEEETDMTITLESVKAHPEIIQAILAEHAETADAKAKDAQIKNLTEQVETFTKEKKAAERKAEVDKALTEAKLPESLLTESFKGLCHAADEAGLKVLLEDRQAIAKTLPAKSNKPTSREQSVTEHRHTNRFEGASDAKNYANALRR